MRNCKICKRHLSNVSNVAELLSDDHKDALQAALCDDHEGGSCPGDPWGRE